MKFVEKKNKEKEIECGDYVLINSCTLGIVAECGREYSILFLENGYFSYDYISDTLEDLLNSLKYCNENKIRIIKSKNIVINEI